VAWCLYPPAGRRGAGPTRAHGWGLNFTEYVANANDALAVILQIEHIDAVDDIGQILTVPGITALFVGPYDLSGSLGLLGQVSHAAVRDAVARVVADGRAAHMPLGLYVSDAAGARSGIEGGFTMIALGSDAGLLLSAARAELAAARGSTAPA
jgi:2-keto-3-deoxy-L-rhamnonate aldolase RhmA